MSIKIDMTSSDVDRQIEVLKHFPEIADRHYRPVLQRDTSLLANIIDPMIPRGATGEMAATFGSKVSGRGFNVKGLVGWYDSSDAWYARLLEYGTAPHPIEITPRRKEAIAFMGSSGGMFFSEGHEVNHPGFSGRGFMAAGYSAIAPIVEADLALANEAVIADLAVI